MHGGMRFRHGCTSPEVETLARPQALLVCVAVHAVAQAALVS